MDCFDLALNHRTITRNLKKKHEYRLTLAYEKVALSFMLYQEWNKTILIKQNIFL